MRNLKVIWRSTKAFQRQFFEQKFCNLLPNFKIRKKNIPFYWRKKNELLVNLDHFYWKPSLKYLYLTGHGPFSTRTLWISNFTRFSRFQKGYTAGLPGIFKTQTKFTSEHQDFMCNLEIFLICMLQRETLIFRFPTRYHMFAITRLLQ